ncbi:MAG: tRNA uridine(34) 5-carboxymethylaminomethyl modification radical SAM/GNAT enzyme Elp3 [Nanoarchaeota archaeon]
MDLSELKRDIARKEPGLKILSNVELERRMPGLSLKTKPVRTGSGVAPIAIMTKPMPCPHGRCSYCPGGIGSAFGDVPQSYTGQEPATLRGARNRYDAFAQVMNRLEQYVLLGHPIDKVELIIMGGTFTSFPSAYQESFIADSFHAMNAFSERFLDKGRFNEFFQPQDYRKPEHLDYFLGALAAIKKTGSLADEQLRNEKAQVRCVALCIETRPDWAKEQQVDEMLRFGTTRVELGVQHIRDNILARVNRGHTVMETIRATQLLKDTFLKVGYHLMPGLPLSSKQEDIAMAAELFSNPAFRPDALKIYPCMVLRGTKLYEEWKQGMFTPLSTEQAVSTIIGMVKHVPPYCRIMRIQRDIPSSMVEGGVDKTNLRQYVERAMEERGIRSQDIRAREPFGRPLGEPELCRLDYEASGGTEVFLSFEDKKQDTLYGFLRLRMPGKPFRKEISERSAGIRELHVYGPSVPIGKEAEGIQHRGLGKSLVAEAEKVAREFGKKELLVISGVGAREYYRKMGFRRKGAYMAASLNA